jgi:5,10-methylenetetrahydromethanopterin reductase
MAAAADRYGYDVIGVVDTPGNAMDPWVAATMVAEATEHARVALCVSNLESRHPAASAAAIASLDLLAPGRVVLGLGTGHSGTRNIGLGRSRVDELAAGARFIRQLLAGELATWHDGEAQLAARRHHARPRRVVRRHRSAGWLAEGPDRRGEVGRRSQLVAAVPKTHLALQDIQ